MNRPNRGEAIRVYGCKITVKPMCGRIIWHVKNS